MPNHLGSVLVTGAAGFIGSHVCAALIERGERVIGLDNFDPYYDAAIKRRNLDAIGAKGESAFAFVECDIRDAGSMRSMFAKHRPSRVIHLAAKAGVRPSIADPVGYAMTNVVGTQIVLEEAKRAGVERAVIASSSSVYGNASRVPFAETDEVAEPISPYAATKRACELIAHTHWHLTKMPVGCLRFFTVFGPRQRPDLAISMFLRAVSRGEEIAMYGDGTSSRDYTFIADIVSGVLASLDRIDRHGFRVWNLGGSDPVTLREMIATVGRVVGNEPRVKRLPMQPGDVERTFADLNRSTAELGYRPATRFEDGVRKQWEWLRAAGV